MFVLKVKNQKEAKQLSAQFNVARNRKEVQSKYGYDKIIVPCCGGWALYNNSDEVRIAKNQK